MKTYSAKASEVTREWYVLDAASAPLGRLASKAATLLTGKGKPMFTAHVDCGDHVIIINAENLVVTGDKMLQKKYYRHSQYPGNLKEARLEEKVVKDPTQVIRLAIKGMIPTNKLLDGRMQRLRVFSGESHTHEAQNPKKVSVK